MMDHVTVHKLLNNHWIVEESGEESVIIGKALCLVRRQHKQSSPT